MSHLIIFGLYGMAVYGWFLIIRFLIRSTTFLLRFLRESFHEPYTGPEVEITEKTRICKHGRFINSQEECNLHPKMKPWCIFRPWVYWLPLPLLVRVAKRMGIANNVWYQDEDFQLRGEAR